jgi:hypothetical protein
MARTEGANGSEWERARDAPVRWCAGTRASTDGGGVALLAQMGFDLADALAAASTWPRKFLGTPASADIVTYHHDPRDDPAQPTTRLGLPSQRASGIRLR